MEGYLKLYRQIIDSEIFASPNGLKIWIWCLCKASYKEKYMTIQIGRGESKTRCWVLSLFGRFKAEQELDLSGSMIYRWMKRFEDLGMINIVSNSHYSIITICNWETYQETQKQKVNSRWNSRWTADEQPLNTNKKDKKDKNIKKEIYKEKRSLNTWRNFF